MSRISRIRKTNCRGTVLPLVAVFISLFFVCLAMSVDLGLIVLTKSDLQNTADASALASAVELIDEDLLAGSQNGDQTDDISDARDYAELYADSNISGFAVDRNDLNDSSGGVVVGKIEDPLDHTSPLQTSGVDTYNSVKVTTSYSAEINGPLQLLLGNFTGVSQVGVTASAVATIENRIVGFHIPDSETLDMLPFTIYEDSWNDAFDGVSDFDQYSVNPETGTVSNGSDGIPEFVFAPWFPNQGIPHKDGNGRTVFITDYVNPTYVKSQIYNGMTKSDLECTNVNGLVLTGDGSGEFSKWVPGEQYMDMSWHTALNNIKGQKRIVSLFKSISAGGSNPTAMIEGQGGSLDEVETCCSIQEWYELSGFEAVVVCESVWSNQQRLRRVVMQPVQMTVQHALMNKDMSESKTLYELSLTR